MSPVLMMVLLSACAPETSDTRPSFDQDDDGYTAEEDCDDHDPLINGGAVETCNTVDDDCDGDVDEDAVDASTFYVDLDGDHYGDPAGGQLACAAPTGMTADSTDCDDTLPGTHPGALETCNEHDEDCDEVDDNGAVDAVTRYLDTDSDGYGDPTTASVGCGVPAGATEDGTDCDDTDAERHPGATEICDGARDEDCDSRVDDDDPDVTGTAVWYADNDSDGYGNAAAARQACVQPGGYVDIPGDCDDTRADRSPGLAEVCDSANLDEDCDALADDADPDVDPAGETTFAIDADGDSFGDPGVLVARCHPPVGYVTDATDCDDNAAAIHPGSPELCDGAVDEDCDGLVDDADPDTAGRATWFHDGDEDGWGDSETSVVACFAPALYIARSGDCDDTAATTNPDAAERCDPDLTDEDCDGLSDDEDPGVVGTNAWYTDADLDGWGADPEAGWACVPPEASVPAGGDCDDTLATRNPDQLEVCDEADTDEDCDGLSDDADPDVAGTCTPPASASVVRFLAVGDTGDSSPGQYAVAAGMTTVCATAGCDFVLLLGDNFYPAGVSSTTDPLWSTAFEIPYAGINTEFWAVMGNHDWDQGVDPIHLTPQIDYTSVSDKWYMPADYYTRVAGDVTFYGIDTQLIDLGAGADQEAWLPGERAASTTTWNILYGHHPYRSNGPHGNAEPDQEAFFTDHVCGQYDLYLSGHDHNMQWLEDTCGTAFIVSGGGHSTYPIGGANPTYFEAASTGFLWVEIDGNTLTGVFYDANATEVFRRTITR